MRKIIAALLAGVIIGTAGTALAAGETVQAVFAKFNFVINDKKVELASDPLVHQGTTYLPVRVISNLLGYDVTYKADSRTIVLETKQKSEGVENPMNNEEWIDLKSLALNYGVYVSSGENLVIGDITVKRPLSSPDRIETYQTERGEIYIKIENGRFYVTLENMREVGIIQ